ncbi:hypothetical protein F5Y11DRAFT_113121 [Daldinia sp. FL1419]|nr:hypothetical protein F5Y11DRAFT_113121 [Daldinia sp. FL1419]
MSQNEMREGEEEPSCSGPADLLLPFHPLPRSNVAPIISIELSLSPPTYCFSRLSAPTIYLRLTLLPTSSSLSPLEVITLYTENSPLSPQRALSRAGFIITDLTTKQPVKLTNIRNVQRMACPQRRVRGSFEEPYFLTLRPDETAELSAIFGRGDFRPDPWYIVKTGRIVDEDRKPLNIRRSASVTGVDGLEPGHEYEISMNVEDLRKIMWAPVAKEEILFEKGYKGPGTGLMDYPWINDQPIEFRVGTTKLKVLEKEEDT